MSKRFCRYYFRSFRPITRLESSDLDRARMTYNAFTFVATLTMGFMSYRYRRMKVSMVEAHDTAKGVSAFQWSHIFNDAVLAFLGYTFGNLIACDYIYKRRIYIVERLHLEKTTGFNRYAFNLENEQLLDEYPFADYVELKDRQIEEERLHPAEVEDQTRVMRERMDKHNTEYYAKQRAMEQQPS